MAKYEEAGNLDSLRLAFDCQVELAEMLKLVKEEYTYGRNMIMGNEINPSFVNISALWLPKLVALRRSHAGK